MGKINYPKIEENYNQWSRTIGPQLKHHPLYNFEYKNLYHFMCFLVLIVVDLTKLFGHL
jgi:hypothetical protein